MTNAKQATRDVRKLMRTLATVGRTAATGSDLAAAAGPVIVRRLAMGAAGMVDPSRADPQEMARLVPEKAMAFGLSAISGVQYGGSLAHRAMRLVLTETAEAGRYAGRLAACRSPAAMVMLQADFAARAYWRALSHGTDLAALAAQAYGEMLAPLHRTATANHRRLRRGSGA